MQKKVYLLHWIKRSLIASLLHPEGKQAVRSDEYLFTENLDTSIF